ncbi:ATP-binding protein [Mariniflexile sp.]|uniref:ATP-binding protein n=1 Tax=Mariniflexile sp. TaxID=1979402 RepID=UPI0035680B49
MKNNTIINATLIGDYCAVPLAFDMSENASETLNKLENIPSIEVGIVYNAKNEIFAEFYKNGKKVLVTNHERGDSWNKFEEDFLVVSKPIFYENELAGTIYLRVSTLELTNKIREYIITMGVLLFFLFTINYVLASYLQRILSGPILKLTRATREISNVGNYKLRVQKQGNDEIGLLVEEYNKMLAQIFEREEALKRKTKELTKTLGDLKQMQQKLVNSEKLVALGQLIAGVAHEINTPLGAIRSSIGNIKSALLYVLNEYPRFVTHLPANQKRVFYILVKDSLSKKQLLTSKEERAYKNSIMASLEKHAIKNAYFFADAFVDMMIFENIEKYLDILKAENAEAIFDIAYKITGLQRSIDNIDFAADRASKVVFALKNSSRINSYDEQVLTDVSEGIENVLILYNNQIKHGIEVVRNYKPIPEILCYSDELNQVWTNILHNAIYAMDLKGKLVINVHSDKEYVIVSITDNGKGIPPDEIDKIFNPFYTTKPTGEGTGIGLYISKGIIEKHKGKIEVESKPGKTTFSVYLPIHGSAEG